MLISVSGEESLNWFHGSNEIQQIEICSYGTKMPDSLYLPTTQSSSSLIISGTSVSRLVFQAHQNTEATAERKGKTGGGIIFECTYIERREYAQSTNPNLFETHLSRRECTNGCQFFILFGNKTITFATVTIPITSTGHITASAILINSIRAILLKTIWWQWRPCTNTVISSRPSSSSSLCFLLL